MNRSNNRTAAPWEPPRPGRGGRSGSGWHGRWRAALVAGFAALVVSTAVAADGKVRIAGTDVLGPAVIAVLDQQARDDGSSTEITFKGSLMARDRLKAGAADLAVLVDDPQAAPLAPEFVAVPLGYLTAVVVAPVAVTIDQINFDDLARIYGSSSAVANSYWSDLGAAGKWAVVPITRHLPTAAVGLSTVLLQHVVLHDEAFKADVKVHDSLAGTLAAVAAEDGGLGVVPWLPEQETRLRTLPLAPAAGQVAFSPTPQNLHAGDYPLRLPVRLVFARADVLRLLPWLRVWYGDAMSAALLDSAVVPLPAGVRGQQVFDLEDLK